MDTILILGAGRSSASLIDYLLKQATTCDWEIWVADLDLDLALSKIGSMTRAKAWQLDVDQRFERRNLIRNCQVVISMLPPHLHTEIAQDCLDLGVHLFTASYLSDEMRKMDDNVKKRGLLFMNEIGLDPGIDHMSAMAMIHEIQASGALITSFRSYTGGLISPESDDNPWHYKVTWNPRNVVLAGLHTARYLQDGLIKYVPHQQIFERPGIVEIKGYGPYAMYPNRDSIPYSKIYGLEGIKTIIRGTLRHLGFCGGWSGLVRLGLTDPNLLIDPSDFGSYQDLLEAFLSSGNLSLDEKLRLRLGEVSDEVLSQIKWLFDATPLPPTKGTMADFLQSLLVLKWALKDDDRDLVIMKHEIEYIWNGESLRRSSTMVQKGFSKNHTAMTNLVGLPLAICVKLLLQQKIQLRGVQIPTKREIWEPVMNELDQLGIRFSEEVKNI